MADNTVFVGGLPANYDKRDVTDLFKSYGDITRVDIRCKDNRGPAFAFVDFSRSSSVRRCIDSENSRVISGQKITVERARRPFMDRGYRRRSYSPRRGSGRRSSRSPRRDYRGGGGGYNRDYRRDYRRDDRGGRDFRRENGGGAGYRGGYNDVDKRDYRRRESRSPRRYDDDRAAEPRRREHSRSYSD